LINDVASDQVKRIIRDMLSRRVDGLIWTVPSRNFENEWLAEILNTVLIPLVYLNRFQGGNDLIAALDNRLGGRLAVQHLLDQGNRQIGIITGPNQWWEALECETGWREILIENGLENIETLRVVGDWSASSGEVGMNALLTKNPELDAVFVCNDQMALGALQAARNHGLQVPEDLGVVGFDDIPEAAYFYPPLTTVRQDAQALGVLAMDVLCAGISKAKKGESFEPRVSWIKPRLVIRQSSARTQN
jgi:LacI family transcriptional regulator